MATVEKANQQKDLNEHPGDQEKVEKVRSRSFKLFGWRYFGLFKPRFEHGVQRRNAAYEKGYN